MNRYFSELIGTFILVFAGVGAIVVDRFTSGQVGHFGIAATFGLVVMALIYTLGDISGAHFNPAVTIGFWIAKRFPLKEVFPYVFCQVLGGIIAAVTLRLLFPGVKNIGATTPNASLLVCFVFEVILTLILMFVILNVSTGAKEKGIMAGTAIGAVVGLEAMFAGPLTGASMNPARSIGPALASGISADQWLYVVAPIVGAGIAVYLYCLVRDDCCPVPEEGR